MRCSFLRRLEAPTATALTLEKAKDQLRVLHDDEDELIVSCVADATDHLDGADGILGRALIEQRWALDLDWGFVCSEIRLPLPPLISVERVLYIDPTGVERTLDPTVYQVFAGERSAIALAYGKTFPAVRSQRAAITIEYTCGYGGPEDLPPKVVRAIRLLMADFYADREGAAVKESPAIARLLRGIRIPRV